MECVCFWKFVCKNICSKWKKRRNVKVLNMITRIYEDKRLIKLISCNWKCKLNSTAGISNKKWNNDICQCECKKYCTCKKYYSRNPSTCIDENRKQLKRYCWCSLIVFDKITNVTNSVSRNPTNTISTNVTNTVPINYVIKNEIKMDYYIL